MSVKSVKSVTSVTSYKMGVFNYVMEVNNTILYDFKDVTDITDVTDVTDFKALFSVAFSKFCRSFAPLF